MGRKKQLSKRRLFGEFIRSIRNGRGISIKELSERLGYDTRGMISGVESGNAPIPIEQIYPLAKALSTPVETILARLRECEPDLYAKYKSLEIQIATHLIERGLPEVIMEKEKEAEEKAIARIRSFASETPFHHRPFPAGEFAGELTGLYIIRTLLESLKRSEPKDINVNCPPIDLNQLILFNEKPEPPVENIYH